MRRLLVMTALVCACGADPTSQPQLRSDASVSADAGWQVADAGQTDNCAPARARYKDLADIHKYTVARGCAFSADTCHNDEDPPPMHTVGHLWNLINVPCNQGVADYAEWDPFCQRPEDGGGAGVLVRPGDADSSYLIIRLEADMRTARAQMPYGAQPLSDEELYVIRAWINSLVPRLSQPSDPIDYRKTPCPL